MKPKKSSDLEIIIAIVVFAIAIYISYIIGISITLKNERVIEDKLSSNGFQIVIEIAEEEFNKFPPTLDWNDDIQKCVLIGAGIALIIIAYYFTSKRKFIFGKEYGTATWATRKDINNLTATSIMKNEIKQAKKVKTKVGRYFEYKKVYKECRKNNEYIKNIELKKLLEWKEDNIISGKLSREDRKHNKDIEKKYQENKKEILANSKKNLDDALIEAWKPLKLKKIYNEEIENIKEKANMNFISDEEEKSFIKAAEKSYNENLLNFYNGKKRIDKIKEKYKNADAIFTKTEKISIYNYILNNNTLILGGAGSGKTRGYVVPNILQAHSSYVITDPKGEILEKCGYYLEKVQGYNIKVLNLDDKELSYHYNPFKYIHPERPGYEERVLMLIDTIILNTNDGEKSKSPDPFWDKAEKLFLQSIFFFTCDGFREDERNINTALALIEKLKIEEEDDNHNSDLDIFVEIFKNKFGEDHIGVKQYNEFRSKASGKTAKSIVIQAVARLAPFRTKMIQEIIKDDEMELERLGEEKTAIFVVVPPTDNTFNFIAGMLFTQMFQELQYCATQVHKHDGQKLPVPVRFILDEFANTCVIPRFVNILAYARSFGIGIAIIIQSLDQIKEMYKDKWGTIIDNCNTILFLGSITHVDTLKYFSELLGKGTYDKKSFGRTRGRSGSSSQNTDVLGRELLDTSEIRKLPKEDCLLIVSGKNPFYSKKYDLTSHECYKYTSDSNKSYSYNSKKRNDISPHREDFLIDNIANEIEISIENTMKIIEKECEEEKIDVINDPKTILDTLLNGNINVVSDEELGVDDIDDELLDKLLEEEKIDIKDILDRIDGECNKEEIEKVEIEETINYISENMENFEEIDEYYYDIEENQKSSNEEIFNNIVNIN